MSVLNPVVDTWDGPGRRIYLKQGVTEFHPVTDIYAEYKHKRANDVLFRVWEPFIIASGNIKKSITKATPRYLVLLSGCKIIPFDEEGDLYQTGEMITDNPEEDSTLYDTGALKSSVRIIIQPPEAEIIYVSTGSGLSPEQNTKLMDLPDALDNAQAVWDNHSRGEKLDFIHDTQAGKWEIKDNQMLFYAADNITEVGRFDLLDDAGKPTSENVFSRVRI